MSLSNEFARVGEDSLHTIVLFTLLTVASVTAVTTTRGLGKTLEHFVMVTSFNLLARVIQRVAASSQRSTQLTSLDCLQLVESRQLLVAR